MSNWKVGPGGRLYHPTTGAYVGQLDLNGNEQMVLGITTLSSGGIGFAPQIPVTLFSSGVPFLIPPGADNHLVTACWTAKEDIHIINFMPHLHLRGKAVEYKAFYPDGKTEILLNVPEYDFSWQTVYYFKQTKAIPKGTKIMVSGYFDNSAKNRFNPDPTKAVRYGEPTYDEMMIGWMDYTTDNERAKATTAMNNSGSGQGNKER